MQGAGCRNCGVKLQSQGSGQGVRFRIRFRFREYSFNNLIGCTSSVFRQGFRSNWAKVRILNLGLD